MVNLSHPINKHGTVDNWDDLFEILHHTFYDQLAVAPEEHPVFLIVKQPAPFAELERLTEIHFEHFNAPALAIAPHALLALAATDRTTGIVLNFGYGSTSIVPVAPKYRLLAVEELYVGGNDLTDDLVKLLAAKGDAATISGERASVDEMKEKYCDIALDFVAELATATTATYELPGGNKVTLAAERFRCPEALFQPTLIGIDSADIHTLLYESIMNCPVELRAALFANIVLTGGTSLFPGLPARLKKELTALAPAGTQIEIIAPPARNHLSWAGGARMAASAIMAGKWISMEEYQDSGPGIIHRKEF